METQAGWALVIDGDHEAHDLYRRTLGDLGFAVEICNQGERAALMLTRRAFALVLLNPHTPGVAGVEVLSLACRPPAPTPVIVVGEAGDERVKAPGLLLKPLTAGGLCEAAEIAIRRYRDGELGRGRGDLDLPQLYEQIAQVVMVRFRADRTSLMLWSDGSERVAVAAAAGLPFVTPGDTSAPLNDSVSGWVIRHGEPLLLEPDGALPFDIQRSRKSLFTSGVCVPLVVRGQVIGVLTAARRSGVAPFTSADLDQMVPLASQVAMVLEGVQIQHQAQRRSQFLARLNSFAMALMATLDVDQALQITAEHLRAVFPEARGYLFLREAHSPWIDSLVPLGAVVGEAPGPDDLRDAPGLAGVVLTDGVARVRRVSDAADILTTWERQLVDARASLLGVPLKTDAAVYGAIELASGAEPFSDDDLQFMIAFAALVAPALERAQAHAAVAHAAARYRALFESAGDAVLVVDSETQAIVFANPAAERMIGYSQAELSALAPARLIAPAAPGRASASVADLLAGKVTEYEGYIHTRSGYSVPISVAASEVTHEGRRYLLLVARNIVEQQRQAQQMAQSEKLAGMNRLTAAIAHEINNPIQAVQGTLDLLLTREFTDEKRERLLSMAQLEANRMAAIVRRMLDLHRPSKDEMRPLSIHGLLESALAGAASQIQQHNISIEREWAERLPWVIGIGGHLKQVFHDLTVNAVEVMPDGGRLVVRTRLETGPDGSPPHVLVEFADSGPGISDSEARLIFEPFYTSRLTKTGLGLAISYSIIERHGGMISVSSNGSGTTFRVALPPAQG